MQYSMAQRGRTYIIRLEHGEIIHESIENFAKDKKVEAGFLIILGGADQGSKLVVGPENENSEQISPMHYVLDNVHEITGTGTLFPDEKGQPKLHMHISAGRKGSAVTGCIREGVRTWTILEVILIELVNTKALRKRDSTTGFELLQL